MEKKRGGGEEGQKGKVTHPHKKPRRSGEGKSTLNSGGVKMKDSLTVKADGTKRERRIKEPRGEKKKTFCGQNLVDYQLV